MVSLYSYWIPFLSSMILLMWIWRSYNLDICRAIIVGMLSIPIGILRGRSKTMSPSWMVWFISPFLFVVLANHVFVNTNTISVGVTASRPWWSSFYVLNVIGNFASVSFGQFIGGKMIAIGLTGGISTGKSTVSKILKEKNLVVIDADRIAREIVQPGRLSYRLVVLLFGKDILSPDHSIDRPKLGKIIFNSSKKRTILNLCTHPFIIWTMLIDLLKSRLLTCNKSVVFDAPLLYESGILKWFCSPIIVVSCSKQQQLDRLMKRDNLQREDAMKRINSQIPIETKTALCDMVIDNNGSIQELEEKVIQLVSILKSGIHFN